MSKVVVVGSYVTDLTARTPKMPRPGETVLGGPFQMGPGGKGGNQAVAAARLGSEVTMLTKLGKDLFGDDALNHFNKEGINTSYIIQTEDEATGAALIAVDPQGENMIVVSLGACGTITAEEVKKLRDSMTNADVVLLQLETSMEAIDATIRLAYDLGKPVVLNPAPYQDISEELLAMVDYVTPNETEAEELTGVQVTDDQTAGEAADKLHQMGIETVIITLGKKGVYLSNKEYGELVASVTVDAVDTTGAGDSFNGAFCHFLSEGESLKNACVKANIAAALSVTKFGTAPAMPTKAEFEKLYHEVNR